MMSKKPVKILTLQGMPIDGMDPRQLLCILATPTEQGGRSIRVRRQASRRLDELGYSDVVIKKNLLGISQRRTLRMWKGLEPGNLPAALDGRQVLKHSLMDLGATVFGVVAVTRSVVAAPGSVAAGRDLKAGTIEIRSS
jgi:hypothetical protein